MKLNLLSQVPAPSDIPLLCAYEDIGDLYFFVGKLTYKGWRSREYAAWELSTKPDYWCYLPSVN